MNGAMLLLLMSLPQTEAQAARDRGVALYREGRFAEAAQAFEVAAELDPGSLALWTSLGWAYRKAGQAERARAVWTRVLKVDPGRASLWNQVAAIEIENEDWSAAVDSLTMSLAFEPDAIDVRSRLAMAFEGAGRFEEAGREYDDLVRRDPENLTAILRLASFYERAGSLDRAVAALSEASRRIPRYAHIFGIHLARIEARRADQAYALEDFTRAAEGYRDAAHSNPAEPAYLQSLGWAHRRAGELSEAVEVWRVARAKDPRDTLLLRHLADALVESGEREEAERLYLEAWEKAPRSDDVVPYRLAELALEDSRTEEALHWIEVLFRFPRADENWSERVAGLFARLDTPVPGIDVFRARSRVSSSTKETAAAESRLQALAGRHAQEKGDYEGALEHYREALRRNPANRAALRDLGWAQWVIADWDGCAESWTRLAALDANDVYALNLLTHLHLYRRNFEDAIRTATQSLALDSRQPEQSLKLARALHWSERYAEAKLLAETLALDHPDDLDIQRFWAELLMQYHDFARGLPAWQRVLALGASDARAQFYYVKSLYELGHYDAAIVEARRFAATTEPHDAMLRLLVDDALVRGQKAEAGGWLLRLAERAPAKVDPWLELADLLVEQKREGDALGVLEQGLRHQPESVELRIARANVLRRRGRIEEAYDVYRELSVTHPESRELFWGVLQTAFETERHEEALAILDSNRSTFLKPYEVLLERARLLYASKHAAEAREILDRAAKKASSDLVLPILLYHGLGDHPRTGAMPLELFASQMKALSEAGYEAVTIAELARIERGELPAPKRPIVISFDDARIDSFELADGVLEKYGMKATMFVPTGLTLDGHPFFADWERLRRFAATGRWDLQAHGHHAHDLIETSADGSEGGFLVNRMWLPDEARLETEEEYLARLEGDYLRVKQELESRIPGAAIAGYAFPFSEAGQERAGNEPAASRVNERFLSESYRYGFIQDANGYNEIDSGGRPLFLKRYSVPRDFDGRDLLRRLAREHPRTRALSELARIEMWTGRYSRSKDTWETVLRESPVLADETSFYLASIDYQQGGLRAARRHLDQAKRSERGVRSEEIARLERRIAWEESFRVEPRYQLFQDSAERINRSQALGFTVGSLAPVELRASFGTVSFEQESLSPFEALEGDLGLSLRASSHLSFDARVRSRRAETDAPDSTNYWGTIGIEGDRAELHLRAGLEDVDTLTARLEGVELRTYQLQHLLKLAPSLWAQLDARYGEYSDSNQREDWIGRITFRPGSSPAFRIGGVFGFSDTLFPTLAYYAPEELRFARGVVSYAKGFSSGWSLDASVELGWARDSLRGDRFTAYARGSAVQAWTSKFRSSVGWSFGSSPGYQSWSVVLGAHFGFTSVSQSSFTAQ